MVNYEYSKDEQSNVVPSVVPEVQQDYESSSNVVSQHYMSAVPSEVEDVLGQDVDQQSEY